MRSKAQVKKFSLIGFGYFKRVTILIVATAILLSLSALVDAQESPPGPSFPKTHDTDNSVDKNLRSLAKVNPSTFALELSIPLMSYPGRNGNSLSVGFNYSSKVWRFKDATSWYTVEEGNKHFITDVYPLYAELSAGGWTSSLPPPRIDDEKIIYYNHNGNPYGDNIRNDNFHRIFNDVINGVGFVHVQCDNYSSSTTGPGPHCKAWYFDAATSVLESDPDLGWQQYYIPRLRVVMPDGSTQEFRSSDNDGPQLCSAVSPNPCGENYYYGTFLSVDGSGSSIFHDANGYVLYLPNGSRYEFPNQLGAYAQSYTDVNGNRMTYHDDQSNPDPDQRQFWIDTLGRHIADPMQHNLGGQQQWGRTQSVDLPGLNGAPQHYELKWESLKPPGCESSSQDPCQGESIGGALEDQTESLFYSAPVLCQGPDEEPLPRDETLFPNLADGIRPCSEFGIGLSPSGSPTPVPVRFNPVVLSKITLPNGQKYEFAYNRFGEISKITYPTGSYEKFVYGNVPEVAGATADGVYSQTNRGVVERTVYEADGGVPIQKWKYLYSPMPLPTPTATCLCVVVSTTQSRSDNVAADGAFAVTYFHVDRVGGLNPYFPNSNFGYRDPLAGMPYDELVYDESPQHLLRSRVLTDYSPFETASAQLFDHVARRDARVTRKISIICESGSTCLATQTTTDYDTNNDPSYFAHLNPKKQTSYHYVPISYAAASSSTLTSAAVASLFSNNNIASATQTDYSYDPNYKARGITSRPIETRVMDPAHPTDINYALARTQTEFDESAFLVADSPEFVAGDFEPTWIDPTTDPSIPPNSRALRENPTTTKVWDKDNNTWIAKHTQYDQYGNVRKAWDANEAASSSKFVETQYSLGYGCAYPTKVIAPAPNASASSNGTNETSTVETTYDFTTGLPLAVKDDFGQITTTEYDDALLRPTRVNPVVVNGVATGPVTETIYDDNALTIKVRKQLDPGNWDEATTFMDSFGRAIKTQAKDSEGDVFVETYYDLLGRVDRVTNPYRAGDTVYWSKTRYDAAGRAVQTYAPAIINDINANNLVSLGTTAYGISTEQDYVGTVVTTSDASKRKSRSITNALGQLMRVDEPTGISEDADTDLGAISSPSQPTYYSYDAYGKMVKVQQGDQARFFKYDSLGRLIRVRQPEQDINADLDLNDSASGNSQWTAGFTYDVLGNVLRATDANGTNIINDYDRANRVIKRCYTKPNVHTIATGCSAIDSNDLSPETPAVDFYYDGKGLAQQQSPDFAKGKLTKVDNGISASLYSQFDNFGRITQSSQITDAQTYTSAYTYNLSGALVEETYPSGRVVRNEFKSDGDLAKISSRKSTDAVMSPYATGFSYTADGKIKQLTLGNHLLESASFNNRLQVTELDLGHSTAGDLWKLGYEYGELRENGDVDPSTNTGNIGKQTLTVPGVIFVQRYSYDSLYRLTSAKETAGESETWSQTFDYDRYGNRIDFHESINGSHTPRTAPEIDPATNRFSSHDDFHYDHNGNIVLDKDPVRGQDRTFVFNGDNKQTEVTQDGRSVGKYFYDGEGKRVKKVTDTETTVFVYSSGKLVAEYSTATPPEHPTINYTATDMLGSPRVITNALGNVVSRRDFMPFGEDVVSEAGGRDAIVDVNAIADGVDANGNLRSTSLNYQSGPDAVRQRFTGYQKDTETSLDFAEARMYESRYGRFTAVDPLLASGKSADPQSFNRYVYVSNNPLIGKDPHGMNTEWVEDKKDSSQPVWVSHEEFLKGGYKEFDSTYTSAGGNSIRLDPNGPFHIPGTSDWYSGWSLNGVAQGTGIYAPTESGGVPALVRGFNQGLDDVQTGASIGLQNVPSAFCNTVTTALFLPAARIRSGQDGLPELFIPNPLLMQGVTYGNERQARVGRQVTMGVLAAPGVAAAPFAAGTSLSVVPEVSAVSSRSAASTAFAETGSYLHRFESGNFYAGKGPVSRMNATGRALSREYNDPLVSSEYFPASSNRAAFMNEHKLMMENGGPLTFDPLSPTYNKIFSPGRRFCQ
jgi:RHS repeat-associated protein